MNWDSNIGQTSSILINKLSIENIDFILVANNIIIGGTIIIIILKNLTIFFNGIFNTKKIIIINIEVLDVVRIQLIKAATKYLSLCLVFVKYIKK